MKSPSLTLYAAIVVGVVFSCMGCCCRIFTPSADHHMQSKPAIDGPLVAKSLESGHLSHDN